MSDLKLTFDDVAVKTSEFLGTGGTATTKSKDITYRGYRNFLFPINAESGELHRWSFLRKYDTLVTVGSQWKYALPSDFANVEVKFIHDSQSGYPSITKLSADAIMQKRVFADLSSYPEYFAIVAGNYTKETGQGYEVWFYGTPNGQYIIPYWYIIEPEKPTETTDVFVGGILASEAILECALAVAETQEEDRPGHHVQLAEAMVQKLIKADKSTIADILGKMYTPSGLVRGRFLETIDEDDVYT